MNCINKSNAKKLTGKYNHMACELNVKNYCKYNQGKKSWMKLDIYRGEY